MNIDVPQTNDAFGAALRLHQQGRLAEAEAAYRTLVELDPAHAQGHHLLGLVLHERGRHDAAAAALRQAIALMPYVATMHLSLGNTLRALGDLAAATAAIEKALELRPDLADAHNALGNVLSDRGMQEQAAACFRRAIHLQPDMPEAHNNLGVCLMIQGRLELAEVSFRQSLALRPDDVKTINNLGTLLVECQRLDTAIDCYRRAVALNPDYLEARVNLGMTLLAKGEMAEGWREYERRFEVPPLLAGRQNFTQPQWCGEHRPGQTLLIHAEQGFGDTIQFCRYAALAAQRGLRVVFLVQRPLVRLLRSMPAAAEVIGDGDLLPHFDVHCPMMSLPWAVGTAVATIPAFAAYLHAEPAAAAAWGARLDAVGRPGPRIGLVWAGNPRPTMPAAAVVDRRRSIDPARLAPLFALPGLHFVSLQKDGPRAPADAPVTDFMSEMTDFADTASLIANLDLVVSVDSAVLHLAAALGKPVWMLNRYDSCWRWLTGRRDSPWYPGLRIYRQPRPQAWEAVIAHVAHDLREFGRGK